MRRPCVLVGVALLAFALTGAARAVTVTETMPFDIVVDNPCTPLPEEVLITGQLRVSMNASASAGGGTHLYTFFNLNDSTAVDLLSGTRYQLNSELKPAEFNDPAGPTSMFWAVNSHELVSLDKTPNFLTHLVVRVTVGPGYVPAAAVDHVRIECSGQAEPVFLP